MSYLACRSKSVCLPGECTAPAGEAFFVNSCNNVAPEAMCETLAACTKLPADVARDMSAALDVNDRLCSTGLLSGTYSPVALSTPTQILRVHCFELVVLVRSELLCCLFLLDDLGNLPFQACHRLAQHDKHWRRRGLFSTAWRRRRLFSTAG